MSLRADALAAGVTDAEFADLKTRHAEPHRHYHTWAHIEALHNAAQPIEWHDRTATILAILFHDAIYKPTSRSNEDDSADLLLQTLRGRVAEGTLHRAERLIRSTSDHKVLDDLPDEERSDANHFLDIDMGILATPREIYARYAENVRKEFAHIPLFLYKRGRARILANFLGRERLFLSERFHTSHDEMARENIRWELKNRLGRAGRRALRA